MLKIATIGTDKRHIYAALAAALELWAEKNIGEGTRVMHLHDQSSVSASGTATARGPVAAVKITRLYHANSDSQIPLLAQIPDLTEDDPEALIEERTQPPPATNSSVRLWRANWSWAGASSWCWPPYCPSCSQRKSIRSRPAPSFRPGIRPRRRQTPTRPRPGTHPPAEIPPRRLPFRPPRHRSWLRPCRQGLAAATSPRLRCPAARRTRWQAKQRQHGETIHPCRRCPRKCRPLT